MPWKRLRRKSLSLTGGEFQCLFSFFLCVFNTRDVNLVECGTRNSSVSIIYDVGGC